MDTDYKNKLLQISHKDRARQAAQSIDSPEARRAGIRRLLQKMQEGPVPDMNTDKEVVDEKENARPRGARAGGLRRAAAGAAGGAGGG